MSFDLHFHIDKHSREGHVLQYIVSRDNVSPEEAIRRLLREKGTPGPAADTWGTFSGPGDTAMLDEVLQEPYARRQRDQ
jgi:hypothetical protein